MDGRLLVRRGAAGILAIALCGWLSTFSPSGEGIGLAVAESPVSGDTTGPHPAPTTPAQQPAPAPVPKPAPKPAPVPVADCRQQKCVALTFDDGPVPGTRKLLDILARRKVRATFFLVGQNAAAYPDLVRRENDAGHEIGNHSYTHADLGHASGKKITSELARTQEAIRRAIGVTPTLMRPPYGSTGPKVASVTRGMGLAQILWTVDPLDWQVRDTKVVERRVVNAVRPGYIVLVHDIHPTTVAAVPYIVDKLQGKGYVFVTVSELFGRPPTSGKKYVRR